MRSREVHLWWDAGDRSQSEAMVRAVLAGYLDLAPDAVPLVVRHGASPRIDGDDLYVSLSHSEGHIVVAVARRPVGVDVECVRGGSVDATLVRRTCTPGERRALAAEPTRAREAAFLRLWTRKEAVSKAIGAGLALDFAGVDVRGGLVIAAGRLWRVRDLLAPVPGWAAAVALRGPLAQTRSFDRRRESVGCVC